MFEMLLQYCGADCEFSMRYALQANCIAGPAAALCARHTRLVPALVLKASGRLGRCGPG